MRALAARWGRSRALLRHYGATAVHRYWVALNLWRFCRKLLWRGVVHDLSKYRGDEARAFASVLPELEGLTYGGEEYRAFLRDQLAEAVRLHYARNSHHPEHWATDGCGGYHEMPPLDVIEMVADWGAAVRRHADGDLGRSIEQNAERFGYCADEAERLRGIARAMGLL